MKPLNPLHRLIREATDAATDDVARIENIMREDIFHSTLDWQTREQLADAAREANRRLKEDRELYDLDHACRAAMFHKMHAEAALRERGTAANRTAVTVAETRYEAARAKLLASLDAETESR